MLRKFENTLINKGMLSKNQRIILGVSGGVDSMCMLDLFMSIKDRWKLEIYVVHINHKLRGISADADADIVKRYCQIHNISFILEEIDVEDMAKRHKKSFEEMAREIRYQVFNKYKKELCADKIAVAHNQNDQAETVIMRFLRGSGIDGLAGMEHIRADGVIRPLLSFSREEIENYANDKYIEIGVDETNTDIKYTRNRIRYKLIPSIQNDFNANIIKVVATKSEEYRQDSDYINVKFNEIWDNAPIVVDKYNKNVYGNKNAYGSKLEVSNNKENMDTHRYYLSLDFINNLHSSMQTRFIRKIIEQNGNGLKNIGSASIFEVKSIINDMRHGAVKYISGLQFEIVYDDLCWKRSDLKIYNNHELNQNLQSDKSVCNDENKKHSNLKVNKITTDKFTSWLAENKNNKYNECIDMDRISGELYVRFRKSGDMFSPLGMNGEKKLKDFFIDEKVPKDLRDNIPLVCDDKGIIWVVGYRLSNRVKRTNNTKNIVILAWK